MGRRRVYTKRVGVAVLSLLFALCLAALWVSPPVFGGPIGIVPHTSPSLDWTGEPGFEADGVSPDAEIPSTVFEWRVRYTDSDDDPPDAGYPLLHVLKSGSEISGSPFQMAGADPSDTTYADGKVYWYFRSLALGTDYTYYFEARSLGQGASTSVLPGPTVSPPPNQPPLVFLNSPTGGERWPAGGRRFITWGMGDPDGDPDSLTVDLFLLEGTNRQRIAGPLLSETMYDWSLPPRAIRGARVEIVVTDPGGLNASDVSGAFDIVLSSDTTPPVARFTVDPQSPHVGASVALDGSTSIDDSGSIASYTWSIYDAGGALVASYSGPTATHAFASSGTYRIVLNVTDASGNWDEEEQEVLVRDRGQTPGAFPVWILGMILLAVVTLVVVTVLLRRRKKRVELL